MPYPAEWITDVCNNPCPETIAFINKHKSKIRSYVEIGKQRRALREEQGNSTVQRTVTSSAGSKEGARGDSSAVNSPSSQVAMLGNMTSPNPFQFSSNSSHQLKSTPFVSGYEGKQNSDCELVPALDHALIEDDDGVEDDNGVEDEDGGEDDHSPIGTTSNPSACLKRKIELNSGAIYRVLQPFYLPGKQGNKQVFVKELHRIISVLGQSAEGSNDENLFCCKGYAHNKQGTSNGSDKHNKRPVQIHSSPSSIFPEVTTESKKGAVFHLSPFQIYFVVIHEDGTMMVYNVLKFVGGVYRSRKIAAKWLRIKVSDILELEKRNGQASHFYLTSVEINKLRSNGENLVSSNEAIEGESSEFSCVRGTYPEILLEPFLLKSLRKCVTFTPPTGTSEGTSTKRSRI